MLALARSRWLQPLIASFWLASWCAPAAAQEEPEAAPAAPAVASYAKQCFAKLHLDPADLAGPFNCTIGKRLVTTVHGQVADRDKCQGDACQTGLPEKCDRGAWLDDNCYGHSYLQVLPTPSNPKVKAALLCRHKTRWELGPAPLIDLNDNYISGFDDVAMIVHNEGNGETCWFQSPDGEDEHLDGASVPGPATVTREGQFWITPESTRDIMCVKCHDSGPWMNSPWIYTQAGEDLGLEEIATPNHPYKNSTPPFDAWPEPKFVKLTDDETCTTCHHIAAARRNVSDAPLGGPHFKTCTDWIERTIGGVDHPRATDEGKSDELRYWMPLGHGLSAADWEAQNRAAVERVKACCLAVGTQPQSAWPSGCVEDFPVPSCPVAEDSDGNCPVDLEF